MATGSSIMDNNSYAAGTSADLDPETRALTMRRELLLGGAYRLFYRQPVTVVRGEGQYLYDAAGRKYLDMYNNVASIGHAHPAVVAAVSEQMQRVNTHTRYLHEGILDYTEQLRLTLPPELDRAMYMCTGSEANDLAIRVAKMASGGEGIVVTREAYHGTTELTSGVSPALGDGQPISATARIVDAPNSYRVRTPDLGAWFADQVRSAIASMEAAGITFAGLLVDSIFSSDGVLPAPAGFLREAVDVVHEAGGIVIADEVQPGFGRTGEAFWGFQRHGILPDIVTLGKAMGNGIPVSGLVARGDVLSAFSDSIPYFNTFGGNPVSMAAAKAVLDTVQNEQLQEHSAVVGAELLATLKSMAGEHQAIGDVRGAGLFIGVELVTDPDSRTPDRPLALSVLEELRSRGVLTSTAGPGGNVLKLRPPLAFQREDIDWLVTALDESLRVASNR